MRISPSCWATRKASPCNIRRENAIPYVSMVDAGTVELVRSVGPKIFTSADLVQKYEACWTAEQLQSHLEAGEIVDLIIREAFQLAAKGARDGKPLTEYVLKQWILKEFDAAGVTRKRPDVAVDRTPVIRICAGGTPSRSIASARIRSAVCRRARPWRQAETPRE